MQSLNIPASIWLNLVILVGAGLYVWFRLAMRQGAVRKERRAGIASGGRAVHR